MPQGGLPPPCGRGACGSSRCGTSVGSRCRTWRRPRAVLHDLAGYRDDLLEALADLVEQPRSARHRIPQKRINLVAIDVADDKDLQVVHVHVEHTGAPQSAGPRARCRPSSGRHRQGATARRPQRRRRSRRTHRVCRNAPDVTPRSARAAGRRRAGKRSVRRPCRPDSRTGRSARSQLEAPTLTSRSRTPRRWCRLCSPQR